MVWRAAAALAARLGKMESRQTRVRKRAQTYQRQGNHLAAQALYEALIADNPNDATSRLNLISIALRRGRVRQAAEHADCALRSGVTNPVAIAQLATCLARLGEAKAVRDSAKRREIAESRSPPVLAEMALALSKIGEELMGLPLLERAIEMGMDNPHSRFLHGTLLTHCGRLDEAKHAFEHCLQHDPSFAKAYWSISKLSKQTPARNHVPRLQGLLAQQPLAASAEADLAFALFKELDDLGRHEEAWAALERGCMAKRRDVEFNPRQDAALFQRLMELCTPAFLAKRAPEQAGPAPIFIVGMPRSGTTLLERMLGNHPEIANAGELLDFPLQLRWSCDRHSLNFIDEALVERARHIDYEELGARYLARTQWRAKGASHYTDKLPANYLQIGFIHRALPRARILHMVRDPMATCFSNLKELFGLAYPHSYDQIELADHYVRYRRLMAHWHQLMPGRILDVSYSDLVRRPEDMLRQVLAFCGLPHVPECSRIERNATPVATASSVQVREPVHTGFLANWTVYESQLAPLQHRIASTRGVAELP